MLVLTRKVGETIVVPELGVEFQIVRIVGNRVSVGVTAPPERKVLRAEILDRQQPRDRVA